MSDGLEFLPLQPEHLLSIEPQDSQRLQYGIPIADISWSEAAAMAEQDNCWAVVGPPVSPTAPRLEGGRQVLACLGINETFADVQGVSWAFLARDVGRAMVPITKFARDVVIGTSDLTRIEAIVRCTQLPDWIDDEPNPEFRGPIALAWAVKHATPQVTWAIKVGLEPVAVLRRFGAASETHMLLERIRA